MNLREVRDAALQLMDAGSSGESVGREFVRELSDPLADAFAACLIRLGFELPLCGDSAHEKIEKCLFDGIVGSELVPRLEPSPVWIQHVARSLESMASRFEYPTDSYLSIYSKMLGDLECLESAGPLSLEQGLVWPFFGYFDVHLRWSKCSYDRLSKSTLAFDLARLEEGIKDSLSVMGLEMRYAISIPTWRQIKSLVSEKESAAAGLSALMGDVATKAHAVRELPLGWEPNGLAFPSRPVRGECDLIEWLQNIRKRVLGTWQTSAMYTISPQSHFDVLRRALRNARRALREWTVKPPEGFNDNPSDFHDAERQLETLIDTLSKSIGQKQSETTGDPPKRHPDRHESRDAEAETNTTQSDENPLILPGDDRGDIRHDEEEEPVGSPDGPRSDGEDKPYPFGLNIDKKARRVSRFTPGVDRDIDIYIANDDQWNLFTLVMENEGTVAQKEVQRLLTGSTERTNAVKRLRTALEQIQLDIRYEALKGYVLKEFQG